MRFFLAMLLFSVALVFFEGEKNAQEPGPVFLSIEKDPVKGESTAKLAIIEFSDYQCPFCARHFRETLPQIEKDYIKTGKVRYVFRDFPIEHVHREAMKAHEAARCAGEQGRYWEMHDQLFTNQRALDPKDLLLHARTVALDLTSFSSCLAGGKYLAGIRRGLDEGLRLGVTSTPTFLLGVAESKGAKIRVSRGIKGAVSYSYWKRVIQEGLSENQ